MRENVLQKCMKGMLDSVFELGRWMGTEYVQHCRLLTLIEGQDWACSALEYEASVRCVEVSGTGNPAQKEAQRIPPASGLGGLGRAQSSSSEDCFSKRKCSSKASLA